MADKICTHCGYEGKAIKRPSDAAGEKDNETSNAFDKLCRVIFLATGIPVKPIAMFLTLPIYLFVVWPLRAVFGGGDNKKFCPNCGLPLMVSLKSDAGWLAKRKNDIKSGAVVVGELREEKPVVAFGKDVKLPGDEREAGPAPVAVPERLPSLEQMFEEPEKDGAPAPVAAEKPPVIKKPPVNPDEW